MKTGESARDDKFPARRALLWHGLALMGYFVVLTWGLHSFSVRTGIANRGADMNYTFAYGHQTPQKMAEMARKYGTVCVLEKDGKLIPAESGWVEMGYYTLMQLLGLAGVEADSVLMARIQVGVFLILALLLSVTFGLVARRIFPHSFLLLTLLVVFRHHNEALIYYMIGQWMIVTGVPLLTLTFMILLIRSCPPLRWCAALMLAGFGIAAGVVGFVRESEATAMIASLVVFLAVLLGWRKQLSLRRIVVGIIALVAPYLVTGPAIRKGIVLHRAAKTPLEAREYSGGMRHGPWHVLPMCLGRYENPHGYYYSDYFSMELGGELLRAKGLDLRQAPIGGKEYHQVLRGYYFGQIRRHPGHYARYLMRSTLDYAMFLPYAFFLDRSFLSPIGAHLPAARSDIEYDDWDFVWFGPRREDGTVQMDRSALKNLKPRYFYFNWICWLVFAGMTAIIISGVFLQRKLPEPLRVVLLGLAIVLVFQSILRIMIPMHGWGAVLTYYVGFCMVAVCWVEYFMAWGHAGPLWVKLGRGAVIAVLVLLGALATICIVHGNDPPKPSSATGPVLADQPELLQEGYRGYNVVRFDGRYYGFPQGFLPDYSDPHLADHPGVIVADSPQEVRRRILILTEKPD